MSPTQLKAYTDFIESTAVKSLLSAKSNRNSSGGGGIDALRLIMQLKQLCTHPNLVRETEGDDAGSDADADEEDDEGSHLNDDYEIDSFLSEDSEMERKPKKQEKVKKSMAHQGKSIAEVLEKQRKEMIFKQQSVNATELFPQVSGKVAVIDQMLQKIYEEDENNRVVLVSNSTKTLDFLENLCNFRKMVALRLDGSTPQPVRQSLVNRFNDLSSNIEREKRPFAFLLSAKAGGCGLNLIGANRLILVDPDWNPAVDQQAAARIWRDGQKKTVFIYRCLSTGTIEERIFQRQIMKLYTASGIVSSSSDTKIEKKQSDFSRADLKELFTFQQHTHCDTYDLMKKKFEEGKRFSSVATSSKNKKRKRIIVEESEDEEEFGDVPKWK